MRYVTLLLFFVCCVACSNPTEVVPEGTAPSGRWIQAEDHSASETDGKVLEAVRQSLNASRTKPVDYEYRITKDNGQYKVLVWYVVGYGDGGRRLKQPGGNAFFTVGKDYTVQKRVNGH